jgi:CRISPR/Cas system CSM-associated protein Csm3 (group 7 of RAMP superfamily)
MIKKYTANIRAITHIQHNSDETFSTDTKLRRTKLLDNNDKIIQVPYITGNSIAGRLRRLAFQHLLINLLDIEEDKKKKEENELFENETKYEDKFQKVLEELNLHNSVYHLLFAGGSLSTSEKLNIDNQKTLREIFPMLSLFGTAYNSDTLFSKMIVDEMYPVCKETIYQTGIEGNLSCWDLVEEQFYTRHDDLEKSERNKNDNPQQMKYNIELFIPGTKFVHTFGLRMTNELEESAFGMMIELWKDSPYIGGKMARGHGKLEIKYQNEIPSNKLYLEYIEKNKKEIKEYLVSIKKRK